MKYEQWRDDIFGQPPGSDPVTAELSLETYRVPPGDAFDYIDRALLDPEIHGQFTVEQIAFGLSTIYQNTCSDLPFCYIKAGDEDRRIAGIKNLKHLYSNFFSKYCETAVQKIGNGGGSPMGSICYMFWDVFVLYPGNATDRMVDAGLEVMDFGLHVPNDSCIVSAIHGLGHWVFDAAEAKRVLQAWLDDPNTGNLRVLDYARQARSGCIM